MQTTRRLLDVVALLTDVPDRGLVRGQVGTIVEILDGAFEVEFSDDDGRTYAEIAVGPEHLLVLHHRPRQAALDAERGFESDARSHHLVADLGDTS